MEIIYSQRGHPLIVYHNFVYRKNRGKYWRCINDNSLKCSARLTISNGRITKFVGYHSHDVDLKKIAKGRKLRQAISNNEINLEKFTANEITMTDADDEDTLIDDAMTKKEE